MGDLLPNEPLIYERSDGVVYARYRDKPEIPRWIIGGEPGSVSRAQGTLVSYGEWQHICELSNEYPTLKVLLDKVIVTYYLIREQKQ